MDYSDVTELKAEISREFPSFRIAPKSQSKLMVVLNWVVIILSFGQSRSFMSSYTTTVGTTVYTPVNWDVLGLTQQYEVLRHERIHMRQAKALTRPIFSFLYLFVFPLGFSPFRAHFEMEAYEESLRALHDAGMDISNPALKYRFVSYFTGSSYLWMWPFKFAVERWYDAAVAKILR